MYSVLLSSIKSMEIVLYIISDSKWRDTLYVKTVTAKNTSRTYK